jgi:hypothetical protein
MVWGRVETQFIYGSMANTIQKMTLLWRANRQKKILIIILLITLFLEPDFDSFQREGHWGPSSVNLTLGNQKVVQQGFNS